LYNLSKTIHNNSCNHWINEAVTYFLQHATTSFMNSGK
jgi:hypothetical protein